jgi:heme-degrading monooxygenase HmoA
MILRVWRAYAGASTADRYPRHLLDKVRPELERIAGFRRLFLVEKRQGDEVEYVVQTLWDSMDAIRTFAGPHPEMAVVEPAAAAVLLRFDEIVDHYEVLAAPVVIKGN